MILNSFEFKVERRLYNKSVWCCTLKDRLKCKARCVTYGKTLELKRIGHNHESTFKGQYEQLSSQVLNIMQGKIRNRHKSLNVQFEYTGE